MRDWGTTHDPFFLLALRGFVLSCLFPLWLHACLPLLTLLSHTPKQTTGWQHRTPIVGLTLPQADENVTSCSCSGSSLRPNNFLWRDKSALSQIVFLMCLLTPCPAELFYVKADAHSSPHPTAHFEAWRCLDWSRILSFYPSSFTPPSLVSNLVTRVEWMRLTRAGAPYHSAAAHQSPHISVTLLTCQS